MIDRIRRELSDCGTDPAAVLFEITETAAAQNLASAQTLVRQLTEMGCGVALDDFGTGYGSFTYLKHLPVTQIKIDTSFIRGLVDDEADRRVVKSIIQTAANFEMKTVAEGVEDAGDLRPAAANRRGPAPGQLPGPPQPAARPSGPSRHRALDGLS